MDSKLFLKTMDEQVFLLVYIKDENKNFYTFIERNKNKTRNKMKLASPGLEPETFSVLD